MGTALRYVQCENYRKKKQYNMNTQLAQPGPGGKVSGEDHDIIHTHIHSLMSNP